jgi:hypothetical protein
MPGSSLILASLIARREIERRRAADGFAGAAPEVDASPDADEADAGAGA